MALAQSTAKLKAHLSRKVTLPIWGIYYGFAWFVLLTWLFVHVNQWIASAIMAALLVIHPFVLGAIYNRRAHRADHPITR